MSSMEDEGIFYGLESKLCNQNQRDTHDHQLQVTGM